MKKKKILIPIAIATSLVLGGLGYNFYSQNKEQERIELQQSVSHVLEEYDLIVFGNEPESIATAISAARDGNKTLLVHNEERLGGLFTETQLNYLDIPHDREGNTLSHDVFLEFWDEFDRKNTLSVEKIEEVFLDMIEKEEHLTLIKSPYDVSITENENGKYSIKHITLGDKKVSARYFVDATSDGTVVRNYAKHYEGREEFGFDEQMAVTLVLPVHNVDINLLKKEAKDGLFGGADYTETAIWGFIGIEEAYFEAFEDTNVRRMNMGIADDIVYINALQVYDINPLSEDSKQYGYNRALEESLVFLEWMKENFPSFKNAAYKELPSKLYIRESVHYDTVSRVTIEDVWNSHIPEDVVAMGAYPVDIQGTSKYANNHIVINPDYYGIGYGSSVLNDFDNTFIVGKTAGYDAIAFGSGRIVPTGMALAEAVGRSIKYLDDDKSIQDNYNDNLMIGKLQMELKDDGGPLYFEPSEEIPYKDYIYYEELMYILSEGFLWSDYGNDLRLKETISGKDFFERIEFLFNNLELDIHSFTIKELLLKQDEVSYDDLSVFVAEYGDFYEKYKLNKELPVTNEATLLLMHEVLKAHN